MLVDSDQYLVPHFGKDNVRRAMQLLAQTPEMLARDVARRKNRNWIEDSSLLMGVILIIEVFRLVGMPAQTFPTCIVF